MILLYPQISTPPRPAASTSPTSSRRSATYATRHRHTYRSTKCPFTSHHLAYTRRLSSLSQCVQETCNFDTIFSYLTCGNYDFRCKLSPLIYPLPVSLHTTLPSLHTHTRAPWRPLQTSKSRPLQEWASVGRRLRTVSKAPSDLCSRRHVVAMHMLSPKPSLTPSLAPRAKQSSWRQHVAKPKNVQTQTQARRSTATAPVTRSTKPLACKNSTTGFVLQKHVQSGQPNGRRRLSFNCENAFVAASIQRWPADTTGNKARQWSS